MVVWKEKNIVQNFSIKALQPEDLKLIVNSKGFVKKKLKYIYIYIFRLDEWKSVLLVTFQSSLHHQNHQNQNDWKPHSECVEVLLLPYRLDSARTFKCLGYYLG